MIAGLSITSLLQTPKIAQSQQNYEEYLIAETNTNTEQRLAQTNVGSGESINSNCGENSIIGGLIDAELWNTRPWSNTSRSLRRWRRQRWRYASR